MKFYLAILSLCMVNSAYAHGPTPQKTDESISINATPEVVWKKIIEPCAIAKSNSEVSACEIVNEKQQSITLKNGKKILQEIDEIANAEMTVSYRLSGDIDIAALPVSSLNGKIKVAPDAAGAKVTWTARYYRAFTGNEPPAGQDDEAAKQAIDAFVKAGLNGIKDGKTASNAVQSTDGKCCLVVRNFLKKLGLNF